MDGRTFKIVLMGDGSSGKTSIISRYAQDHFGADYRQTVGVDFFSKSLELPGNGYFYCLFILGVRLSNAGSAGDVHVTLKIWDIGGQSLGGKMIASYLEEADVSLLSLFLIVNFVY